MSASTTDRTSISILEAVRLLESAYRLPPGGLILAPLPGEYDANFSVQAADGRKFVLKIMHPSRSRELVDLQCKALQHIEKEAPDLVVPRVIRTSDDAHLLVSAFDDGASRIAWLLEWIDGRTLAQTRPHTDDHLFELGRIMGRLDTTLAEFDHAGADRDLKWDLSKPLWACDSLDAISDASRREIAGRALDRFADLVGPSLPTLRRSIIHSDANDHNVIVGGDRRGASIGLIDFGDMHRSITVAEPAISATYALLGKRDPLAAACRVIAGYHASNPLEGREFALIHALIGARLAVSVVNSAWMKKARPDDAYVTVSEAPAWDAILKWDRIPRRLAEARFRHACGLETSSRSTRVSAWIAGNVAAMKPVLDHDLRRENCLVLDLGVSSPLLGANPAAAETESLTRIVFGEMRRAAVDVAVGRYDEARLLYVSPLFGEGERPTDERRTVHLGVDLFIESGASVHAPLPGTVHVLVNNDAPQDYGPMVVLGHETSEGDLFFTLYGHLSLDTLDGVRVGAKVGAGDVIGRVGTPPTNGDWAPHVHFQIITDLLELDRDFPGVCRASEREFWKAVCPDPNLILGIPALRFPAAKAGPSDIAAARGAHVGPSVRLSYRQPLNIVRGFDCHLYDETGRAFLDMYNNVPLVGHSHPRVVEAVSAQMRLLNTNTRYLHENLTEYATRLASLLPDPLSVVYVVNSGSEANELALRLARARTGRPGVVVLENAYHGHTQTLIDVSPYKFAGKGGTGKKDFVTVAPMPDDYRGRYRRDDSRAGEKYARDLDAIVEELVRADKAPGAFLMETLPSVGGQIVPPPGYLAAAYAAMRRVGAVCIADEVQVAFGRLGSHFWGFEMQNAVPDIVVVGKPIGNGFPLAAVITTREIATSFDNGMEFFSTFGGNPVACAAGLAVLDVLRDENLQACAREMGTRLLEGLGGLMRAHPIIGDVRGSGLFVGVEFVRDREGREPAPAQSRAIVNRLRHLGVLAGLDGPHENVLKLRPPLTIKAADVDLFLEILNEVLSEDAAQV